MARIREIELHEILPELPEIEPFDLKPKHSGQADVFLCALGFEERCLSIPEAIADSEAYQYKEAILFEYITNSTDNDLNRPRLTEALGKFSSRVQSLPCDTEEFPAALRQQLNQACSGTETPKIIFDISVCSTKLLMLVLKVIFEFDLELSVLYSEANIYHPTKKEYEDDPDKWTTEQGFGIARGVGKVIPSAEHPGNRRDGLPETIVVFPTFKPERTKAVIAEMDESLAIKPCDRVIWVIGRPHLQEDHWRAQIMKEINNIPASAPTYEITTFDYRKTLQVLEQIYQPLDCRSHITISPLGSKLQSLGVALFWYMRQDISIVFAMPEEYNAAQYSEGCKATWQIRFGNLKETRDVLDRVGRMEIIP